MIDFADVKAAIQARMTDLWAATPITSVAFENGAFTPPTDGSGWVRLYVMEQKSQKPLQWTAPETAAQRLAGRVYVVGHVPKGTGDAALEQMLTAAKTLFEGQTFASISAKIEVQESTAVLAGPDGQAPWFKKLIMLPFWAKPL